MFILMRKMEEAIKNKESIVLNFVDFAKAFDSLDWENMWKILEFQGMPPKIVEIIKKMYQSSTKPVVALIMPSQ